MLDTLRVVTVTAPDSAFGPMVEVYADVLHHRPPPTTEVATVEGVIATTCAKG